jgi:hypothetical protein
VIWSEGDAAVYAARKRAAALLRARLSFGSPHTFGVVREPDCLVPKVVVCQPRTKKAVARGWCRGDTPP